MKKVGGFLIISILILLVFFALLGSVGDGGWINPLAAAAFALVLFGVGIGSMFFRYADAKEKRQEIIQERGEDAARSLFMPRLLLAVFVLSVVFAAIRFTTGLDWSQISKW